MFHSNNYLQSILAVIILVGFALYTRSSRVKVTIPGASLEYQGDNDPPPVPPAPAIDARNIKAHTGSVTADDSTGRGIKAADVDAGQDVTLRTGAPSEPKADPPT